ncbi:Alpha/Beta hydrolase protein [Syncephalis pseudoplumigaleata]|uniref:Alpha/Beta hydrolase protein n=1 Tax=Syncephalis pseudoplumigaleata TaxID=1712513 RepID=A0A4P9Z249_9FUNG|nr:Alpha/Beta hydrolase protein [Syncephalis pseudoplumigaleata]|eukprot:RKP26042.1 Alpha/Beta hydrolase protein [Syncephalis pseudoplumigaleata]
MLDEIQRDVPFGTEPGREHGVRCMRLNLDPVRVFPRPLIVYLLIHIGHYLTALCLHALGFRRGRTPHLAYWYRETSAASDAPPIVFVHGLSLGLVSYLVFFTQLCRRHGADRPLVFLHLDHLTYRFPRLGVPGRAEMIEDVARLFERHQLAPAVWMGHSFGTIICAWMCNLPDARRYVRRSVLVDPVCFQLWEPDLTYNAIYRPPPNWLLQLMRCVVSSEHGIALTIGRHFWWYENLLLPEDLTHDTHIVLAEHDGIIDACKLADYLDANSVPYVLLPRAIHAQFLLQPSVAKTILALL